jgi:hypothetical protein
VPLDVILLWVTVALALVAMVVYAFAAWKQLKKT